MHEAPFIVPKESARDYRRALTALNRARVPYVVSGAFAMYEYTGLWRNTKDLDIFLEPHLVSRALRTLEGAGFTVELTDPKWLAKARKGDILIDLIFAAGNMVATVDPSWVERAIPSVVLGVRTRLASPEDLMSWKAFIAERHRFDGADLAHMIQGLEGNLDWKHLLARLGEHWELLLWHVIFFRYIYPCHAHYVPAWLMDELLGRYRRLVDGADPVKSPGFRGTLVSQFSFRGDVEHGYRDLRSELGERGPVAA
jgi:hypothetical protein